MLSWITFGASSINQVLSADSVSLQCSMGGRSTAVPGEENQILVNTKGNQMTCVSSKGKSDEERMESKPDHFAGLQKE